MRYVVLFALAAALSGSADASDWSVSNASSLSSGRYGGTDKTSVATSSLSVNRGLAGWRISATVPYLSIESGSNAVLANGVVVAAQAGRRRQNGYGDVQLRVDRPVTLGGNLPVDMRVAAIFKAPTGARRFSTGKFDGSVSVEMSRRMGALTPFISSGYRMFGDRPGERLANGWTSSAGATYSRGPLTLIGSYERSDAVFRGGPAPRDLFAVASYAVAPGLQWSVYGTKGMNAGSANLMVGTSLTRQIF